MELTGYSVDDFRQEQQTMFINAMASVLNVSPGAIFIIDVEAVEQGTRRRRRNTLAATNSSVAVKFKVELTFFDETETVKESLVTTDPEKITEIKKRHLMA